MSTLKYEYKVVSYDIDLLYELGSDGWRLVCVSGDQMIFERPSKKKGSKGE
jgi:hypothetical protein